jgi:hypothetical protein
MPDNTLLGRCTLAYAETWNDRLQTLGPGGRVEWPDDAQRCGTRAVIEHLAAELTIAGHRDAAGWLMGQLSAQVIELRPRTDESA